jgi:hypothetical protein
VWEQRGRNKKIHCTGKALVSNLAII